MGLERRNVRRGSRSRRRPLSGKPGAVRAEWPYADPSPRVRGRFVRTGLVLTFVLLLSAGCAGFNARTTDGEIVDMSNPEVADRALRGFFREAEARWDVVESRWYGEETSPEEEDPRNLQKNSLLSEYEKFSVNALMLYLRGDWSEDLQRSMHTMRLIVLNGESATGCGSGKDIPVPEIDGYISGTLTAPFSEQRESLYWSKARWNEMNIRIDSRQIHEDLPSHEVLALKDLKQRFTGLYAGVLRQYLEATADTDALKVSLESLEELTREAEGIFGKY